MLSNMAGQLRSRGKYGLPMIVTAFLLSSSALLNACPIPVFQYALENWEECPYVVTIYSEGELEGEALEALALLRNASGEGGGEPQANVEIHLIDLTQGGTRPDKAEELPFMEVRYPRTRPVPVPVWTGKLEMATAQAVLDSPVRQKMGEDLLDRVTAIWLLVESGDESADDAVEAILREELAKAKQRAKAELRETALWGGEEVQIYTDVSFQIIRISRDDPEEAMLVHMLMNSEPDLHDERFAGQPMVFPVYGRGLIMYALIGRGINSWTINEAASFIVGPCSCQIKAANPGLDILMSVQWGKHIEPLAPGSVAPIGTGSFLERMDAAEDELDDGVQEDDRRNPTSGSTPSVSFDDVVDEIE